MPCGRAGSGSGGKVFHRAGGPGGPWNRGTAGGRRRRRRSVPARDGPAATLRTARAWVRGGGRGLAAAGWRSVGGVSD
ncbi:hypothetical protein PSMK_21530 [Phycisphaera mikurensis NBRC 102666]|uniref:Uncharacterized protein n=1 Tax=Phycisphaera mikurensis (strain NBRC 102666 / KCTC 22515 / FYK2301M01) TaxID=1142394 RepID=I0IGC4_PHYMF|nr:hypothetical protein PSMK_21530 [Phycisphaera mikurensis NBRC 102666]